MESGSGASWGPGGALSADRSLEDTVFLLLSFYLDLQRGMEEFRRAFALEGATTASPAADAGAAAGGATPPASPHAWLVRLGSPDQSQAARLELEQQLQEIRFHFAALLEGYQRSVQSGSARLLETLDPEKIRHEIEGQRVQVGPLRLSSGWRPVLTQAIWEEFLRRYRHYRSLDPADFERLFREEYRKGYNEFIARHGTRK
jgi:hypothetical protein